MKEKLVVLKNPIVNFPTNSLFEISNPLTVQNNLAASKIEQPNDDDFDVKVISFEEKSKVVSNLTTKESRTKQGRGNVISFFKEANDYKLKHMDDFRTLADQAAIMARLSAAACAPGDGHGAQTSQILNTKTEINPSSNISSIFEKNTRKEGAHQHCKNCGEDLNDGKCSKCAA